MRYLNVSEYELRRYRIAPSRYELETSYASIDGYGNIWEICGMGKVLIYSPIQALTEFAHEALADECRKKMLRQALNSKMDNAHFLLKKFYRLEFIVA